MPLKGAGQKGENRSSAGQPSAPPEPNNDDVKASIFKRLNFRGREINRRENHSTENPVKQSWYKPVPP